jgi:hypothetical protein
LELPDYKDVSLDGFDFGARLWLKTQPQHFRKHEPPKISHRHSPSSLLRLVVKTL